MRIARTAADVEPRPRAVAIGSFDGVHVGHRVVLTALAAADGVATVVTFDPHPHASPLLTTLDRRLELLAEAGVEEVLVAEPGEDLAALLRAIGARVVVGGPGSGLDAFARSGFDVVRVPLAEAVSSETIRRLVRAGEVAVAARRLGRPPAVEGVVVGGDARGAGLGFPTANLDPPRELLVPAYGIYAGAARGRRAAVSIGVNPHYGGDALRVEAFLLDFTGELYGDRLVVELWQFLREERTFGSDEELSAAIAADVAEVRRAQRPA